MMKKLFKIFILSIIFLSPVQVNALMCSNKQKIQYQEMAKNIIANFEYVEANDDISFSIRISNIPQNFVIYDITNDRSYKYQGSELVIPNASKNTNYKFGSYYDSLECEYQLLYTYYVNVPSYNKYYKDKICNGIEDYKLCSKWLNINYSYETWKSEVNKYINSLEKKNVEEKKETTNNLLDKILDFYSDYYVYILPSIIVLCLMGVYAYNKKHDLF